LRKKITNVVQVLTHVKEKLQFIQAETIDLKGELKQLDEKVTSKRDSLPSLKNVMYFFIDSLLDSR
jgi:predicted nuclease with TOPRIM domain